MSNLVIVESPTKAKTITKFLGKGYIIKSSFGHIRDLPKKEMGIDVDDHFTPTYVVEDKDKKKVVADLKKAAKNSKYIYFATDEDREGEAIAWHLVELLKPKKEQVKRITFHEITKSAIDESLKNPRDIDMQRVNAQQARRILDRLVGYELSPFLWKKVARGLSAGRVQSVAVRLIVEREREIKQFEAKEYWTIDAIFVKTPHGGVSIDANTTLDPKNLPQGYFSAKLHSINEGSLDKFEIADEKHAKQIMDALKDADYTITRIEKKETEKNPYAPFTTSTLQQEANRKLGFSSKQTMRVAQQLYEQGYITYMRTDSLNLSSKFLGDAKQYLEKTFGKEYILDKPRVFKTKSKTAQEAHEAIRPTEAAQSPDIINHSLDKNQHRLYDLIWRRAVASQMPEAIMDNTSIDVSAKTDATYTFRATGQTIKFDGFLKIYKAVQKEDILPELEQDEKVDPAKIDPNQHFTEPPARYSDASLVKTLEENEIGRPSTYAPTISTVIDRGYVDRIENRRLKPTDIAFLVIDILVEHFPKIVDYKFTARMEDELDEIAEGKLDWEKAISEFYEPFKKNLMEKTKTLDKKNLTEEKTDEKCGKCGKEMIIKTGRFGRFLACTGYPECKNTKPLGEDGEPEEVETTNEKCEKCGAAMQVKHGRYGKFLGCSKYPDCKGIKNIEKGTGVTCPECGKGEIIEKKSKKGRTFFACNQYPACKTAFFAKPVGEKCPECGSQLVYGPKDTYKCSSKECKFIKDAE
ncbi:type I DNA topoisomerase [Patescibacteria group bacterium]|nr:type I DNA topoisomerase [Patescibacteria group bacterium]